MWRQRKKSLSPFFHSFFEMFLSTSRKVCLPLVVCLISLLAVNAAAVSWSPGVLIAGVNISSDYELCFISVFSSVIPKNLLVHSRSPFSIRLNVLVSPRREYDSIKIYVFLVVV
jgi:hypothetical protein